VSGIGERRRKGDFFLKGSLFFHSLKSVSPFRVPVSQICRRGALLPAAFYGAQLLKSL
jgi:hypothetical protein